MKLKSQVSVLSTEELKRIHSAALDILQDIGGYIGHPEFCKLMEGMGCLVNGYNVRLPHKVSEKIVQEMRSKGKEFGIDSNVACEFECGVSGQAIKTIDIKDDKIRDATSEDLREICKLIRSFRNVRIGHPPYIVQDVPPIIRDIVTWSILAQELGNPTSVEVFSPETVDDFIELGSIFCGSRQECLNNPPFMYCAYFTPPFKMSFHSLDIVWKLYQKGIRKNLFFVGVMPIVGASAPVTLAGTLTAGTAESILGNAISKALIGEVSGFHMAPTILDMKTMIHSQSCSEAALLYLGIMDLSRFYGIESPIFDFALSSDSKGVDIQAGIEKAYKCMTAVLAGSHIIHSGLGVLSCAHIVSPVQMVIDYEFYRLIARMLKGIEVTDETIALNLIKEKGIGGSFLDSDHTLENYSKELLFLDCFDHTATGAFDSKKDSMIALTKNKVNKILGEKDEASFLNNEQEKAIADVIDVALKKYV